ncbi:hypothetical protein KUV65_12035 [Maritalea mobilis]|uniref:hypothetical protein n=1 Tax=Maritalea mobilis TaxID=483324 RepID=UPI001C96F1BB|nr:hypothetical protein [Maritalea mobilis]MBY6202097.1 hypothetical protein [Maritalea mobilis]
MALRVLFVSLVLVSLLCFVSTWRVVDFWLHNDVDWRDWPLAYKLMLQGNLAQENVLGAWFSSMLLLMAGAAFLLCFAAEPRDAGKSVFRFGWLLFGLVFVGLSLDELGSFHERLALWQPDAAWRLMIVGFILVVPVYMTGFGLVQLRRSRAGAGLIVLGVACFSLIPVYEHFEIMGLAAPGVPGRSGHALWTAAEETTELLGMIAFLAAALVFAATFSHRPMAGSGAPRLSLRLSPPVLAGAYLIVVGLAAAGAYASRRWLAVLEEDGVNGLPENWFVGAPLFLSALVVLALSQGRVHRSFGWAIAFSAVLVSALVGADIQKFFWSEEMAWLKWGLAGALAVAGIIALMPRSALAVRITGLAAIAALAVTVAAMPGPHTLALGLVAVLGLGSCGLALLTQPVEEH